jgi:hypothetical protein
MGGIVLVGFLIYLFKCVHNAIKGTGSGNWPRTEATVSDDPSQGDHAIEIPYCYRIEGELYTGLHEEPVFGGAGNEYLRRFTKGRTFVVRVKPGRPEVSVLNDDDQSDGVRQLLERNDEQRRREIARQGKQT